MAICVLSGTKARFTDVITNRGCASGGSCGGDKKTGLVTYGPTWPRGNMGNFLVRAPYCRCPYSFSLLQTNRFPTQIRRGSYYATHSGTLG